MCSDKGQKRHINFFKVNFLRPPKAPDLGPPEKKYVPHFLGKERRKGTHMYFSLFFRSFEKGLADRGGWRKEIPPIGSGSFSLSFFL